MSIAKPEVEGAAARETFAISYVDNGNDEMTDPQIEKKIEKKLVPIREDIQELRRDFAAFTSAPKLSWVNRNPGLASIITSILAVLLAFGLPRLFDYSDRDFALRLNAAIDQKFTDNHFDDLKASVNQMGGQLKTLSENVNALLGKSLKQAASLTLPQLKRQLPLVDQILNAAKRNGVPAGLDVIRDLHDKLVPLVSTNDAEAWRAIVSLASYRSVFNQNPLAGMPLLPIVVKRNAYSRYDLGPPPQGEELPAMSAVGGIVSKNAGAIFGPIGTDLNPANNAANPYVVFEGGGLDLNGKHVKNAVFIRVHVVYNGGPLILENALFVNCQFSIQQTRHGEEFASKSIMSEAMTFTAD